MKIRDIQNKIMKLIPHDKCLHFVMGFIIFSFINLFIGLYISLGIVFLIATLKELYDYYDYGIFNIVDVIYTIIPGFLLLLKALFTI